MTRIGLISDTHGYIDDKLFEYFAKCDEIWHAGDIGNKGAAEILSSFRPLKAVYGNIDGNEVKISFPKMQRFICEKVDVLITHIGGYPGHYNREVLGILSVKPPKLFICGHSHILKIIYDKKFDLLHLNPGAAGKSGPHNIRTALRFSIDGKNIKDMEIIEIEKKN